MRQQAVHLRGEEEFFHELDVELCDKAFRRAELQEKRHRLEESVNIHNPAILEALEKLGFDQRTSMLLFIVPLVEVAWAAGRPSRAVCRHILTVAGRRGVQSNTPACEQLSEWLTRCPSDHFFQGTIGVISAVLSVFPQAERLAWEDDLLCSCRETAAVHCRLLGWSHRICAAKRKVIAEIRRRLEGEPQVPS